MTTPAAHWEKVQDLLHQALDQDHEARNEWLRGACEGNVTLEQEIAQLLASHDKGLLGEPGAPKLFGLSADHVGPYKIVRPLGQGGMGAVYLAERTTGDVTQTVALKLLRPGFASSQLATHFATERRILARLEHAGIARLIDAGTTPDGQPYFAMEFVDGTDFITWARRNRLRVNDRLRLMLAVCGAVEYAHRQLVVHRDLKPSNILVSEDGKPKLLDFGIGKLIDPANDGAKATRTLHWLTPDYASPEQVRGDPAGTSSDVYSLGVLLYELLTDTRPFQLENLSPAAAEHIISHQPPPRPSERVADRRLRRLLAGDIDTIVLKALAKEPERRYASVRELDEDLRRHLDDQPVRARPDTLAYRTSTFIRRHSAAVAAAVLVLSSLIVGLATTAWQATEAGRARDRAEEAAGAAQQVSSFLVGMFEASDPSAAPGDVEVARGIVRRGVARAEALNDQPLAQARIIDALGMVYVGLGQYDTAYVLVRRAFDTRVALLGRRHPDIAESLRHVGRVERARAHFHEAEAAYREALDIQQRTVGPHDRATIQTLDDLAFLMPYLGNEREAERYRHEALDLTIQYHPDEEALITSRKVWLAEIARRRGNYGESLALLRDAVAFYSRTIGPVSWEVADLTIRLGDVLRDSGAAPRVAGPVFQEGLLIARSAVSNGNLRLAYPLISVAYELADEGRMSEAEAMLLQAIDIRRNVLGPEHPQVAEALDDLTNVLTRAGRYAEAGDANRRALSLWSAALGPDHIALANGLLSQAVLLDATGHPVEAEAVLRDALRRREAVMGAGHVVSGVTLSGLGLILAHQGKMAQAETTLTRALMILRAHQEPTHRDVREVHGRLDTLYTLMRRPQDAARERALSRP